MSKRAISRRTFMTGAAALASGLLLPACRGVALPPTYGSLLEAGDALTFASHRAWLRKDALVREFGREAISRTFPAIGTTDPEDETYQKMRQAGFDAFRLPVSGLVERPQSLSLAQLKEFPARSQITQHNCERGWSAIAEWTGVPLAQVLAHVGLKPEARYVVFHCVDGWWDSIDLLDALHPQTLLAYGMNGGEIPVAHGAPVRLRVERQLGYKSLKFLTSVQVVDDLSRVEDGTGAMVTAFGYSWYAGI
jgi:DMSO/TMAO reductase YedYZ molybdopterin-dependent catalytic subunit